MTLNERIVELAKAIGADVKALKSAQGDLTALTTTQKANLVAAINELKSSIAGAGAKINDADASTSSVYSSQKVNDLIIAAQAAVKDELVDGAGEALDTLKELSTALGDNPNFATEIASGMAKRVRVDAAQTFTTQEKLQGCNNLGIGNPDYNFVTDYTTARG